MGRQTWGSKGNILTLHVCKKKISFIFAIFIVDIIVYVCAISRSNEQYVKIK